PPVPRACRCGDDRASGLRHAVGQAAAERRLLWQNETVIGKAPFVHVCLSMDTKPKLPGGDVARRIDSSGMLAPRVESRQREGVGRSTAQAVPWRGRLASEPELRCRKPD